MNQSEIDAFLAIVEQGSLTKAAEQLYLTQSALSSRLEALEKEVGACLIRRKRGIRRIELTDAGARMVPVAKKWRGLLQETKDAIWREDRRHLSLSAVQSLQAYLMGPVYQRFLKEQENCDLELMALDSESTYHLLENGNLEAGLTANRQYSKKVVCLPLFEEPMCFVCGKTSDYAGRLHPSMLSVRQEIYMKWHHDYVQWHAFWFGGSEKPRVETDSMQLMELLVTRAGMWTVLPLSAAAEMEKRMEIKVLPMEDGPGKRITYLLLKSREDYSEEMRQLFCLLKSYLAEHDIRWLGEAWITEKL